MLRDCRRTMDSRPGHVRRSAADETRLDLLPLLRRTEDVRSTLGVSELAVLHSSSVARHQPQEKNSVRKYGDELMRTRMARCGQGRKKDD